MPWRNKAIEIIQRPNVDYYLFIDESGEHILKNFDPVRPVFTVAGVLISKDDYSAIKDAINSLKLKYWEDAKYRDKTTFKQVCFINRAIRRRQKAFSKYYLDDAAYEVFIDDLSALIEGLNFQIIAACIDKQKLVSKYTNPFEPYNLAMEFIIERYSRFLHTNRKTGSVILEARGKREDGLLHQQLLSFYNNGTRYISNRVIQKSIKGGFYFNKKWQDGYENTYVGLELADLVAHPIGHFVLKNEKSKAFQVIEEKFLGYKNYEGKGLKIFP